MTLRLLESRSAACARFLASLLKRRGETGGSIDEAVAGILNEVRRGGDRALLRLTRRFDGITLGHDQLRVTRLELQAAYDAVPRKERRALALGARRITAFHRHTLEKSFSFRDQLGMRLGQMVRPLERIGIYVPGGM